MNNRVAELSARSEVWTLAEHTAEIVLHHMARPRDITREALTHVQTLVLPVMLTWQERFRQHEIPKMAVEAVVNTVTNHSPILAHFLDNEFQFVCLLSRSTGASIEDAKSSFMGLVEDGCWNMEFSALDVGHEG